MLCCFPSDGKRWEKESSIGVVGDRFFFYLFYFETDITMVPVRTVQLQTTAANVRMEN